MALFKLWSVLVAACAVLFAAPVQAQGVFDMGVLTNTVSIPTRATPSRPRQDAVPRRNLTPGESAVGALSTSFDARGERSADVRLEYTPSPALRRRAVSGLISRVEREYPDAAKTIAVQLARHDYSKIYSGLMRGSGLRDNDAADTVVAYTLLGWQIANGYTAPISNARGQAVRRQIAPALAANSRLSAPQTRADLGEEMKLLYVTLHAGWQSAQREGKLEQYGDGIAQMWRKQSGRDLRRIALTDQGFRSR